MPITTEKVVLEGQNKTKAAFNEVKNDVQGIGKNIKSLNASFAVATVAITAVGGAMAKTFQVTAQFNKELGAIATLIPNNRARIEEMRTDIQALSVQMGKSTTDIAAGMFQVVSAFGDSAEAAQQLQIVAQAATAGAASTTESLDLLSAVTKGYGDTSAVALQKVADLAFMTNKLGQTTFPELAASMGRVVPLSATLGVAQEELFASFATLTGVTGKASEVSTQMAAIQKALIKTTPQMAKAIEKLGFENAKTLIQSRGLVGGLRDIISTTDGTLESTTKLFGRQEALTAVFALTGSQAEVFDDKLQQMSKSSGAATQAFKDQTDGVAKAGFMYEQLKSQMTVVTQFIGEKLDPLFRGTIKIMGWTGKAILMLIEGLEQLKNIFMIAANTIVFTFAAALTGLAVTLKLLLFPISALFDGMVALGQIEKNPFDTLIEGLDEFAKSSGEVLDDSINQVFKTNAEYRKLDDTLSGVLKTSQEIKDSGGLIPSDDTGVGGGKGEPIAKAITATKVNPAVDFAADTQAAILLKDIEGQTLRLQALTSFHNLELQLAIQHGAEKDELDRIRSEQAKERAQQEADFKIKTAASMAGTLSSTASNLSSLMGSKGKKAFEVGKKLAIAQALISAKTAVVGSYKAGALIGGPLLGAAFAATAIIATAKQIQDIKSQQFGGGSVSSVSGGGVPSANIPTERTAELPQRLNGTTIQPSQVFNIEIVNPIGTVNLEKFVRGPLKDMIEDVSKNKNVVFKIKTATI